MNTPPANEPAADPVLPASADFGPKKRSLSFGGLRPLISRNSDGNKSDSGSITGSGSGSGGGKVKGFFANLASRKKASDNSISSGTKATTVSSADDDSFSATDKVLVPAIEQSPKQSKHTPDSKLPTIPQSQPGSEILQQSTSSRTEGGKGTLTTVDPFRQAVKDAELVIDKLQTAYTVLSSISQMASVAQELLPGVGSAVGILANMLKSAKTVAVNKVAALRLVRLCVRVEADDRLKDARPFS
jgi:hypothetical protein